MGKVTEIWHDIDYYECDNNGRMTLPALFSVAVKSSNEQANQLNLGNEFAKSHGVAWVISQFEAKITRMPLVDEHLIFGTEAKYHNKVLWYRDFWIKDQEGNVIVTIQSSFVLMDMVKRRIANVDHSLLVAYETEPIKKMIRFSKIELPMTEEYKEYYVRFYDIDSNQHVNNARYLDWIVDSLDYEFLTTHAPKEVRVKFDKEVTYGRKVNSYHEVSSENNLLTKHGIFSGDQLCCEANIIWE